MSRVLVVFACSSLLAGCAGEPAPVSSFGPNGFGPNGNGWQTTLRMNATGFYDPVAVAMTEDDTERLAAAQKTMAGKVLGAMALERVTGRQPDPSRLGAVN
jgi:PBP1b-binding outer membrane lipoprotein LpoB